ncbi:hypothetical protein TCAL_14406 [Tigriopus californicus]|uniref:Uncharacterized protein n=1 Tax=Tigriopus californicus TaxID=6832 RepID=A0A553PKA7_TIGCA|nr:hypothetical protein TCAL_14406 [Tigriopus californicus]
MTSASHETTGFSSGARSTIEVKMPKFRGDITQFEDLSNAFQALVHETNKSPVEKMRIIKASHEDEARLLISGYGNSKEYYLESLRVIGEVYGDPLLLVESHQKEIENFPKVKPKDLGALKQIGVTKGKEERLIVHGASGSTELKSKILILNMSRADGEGFQISARLHSNVCQGLKGSSWENIKTHWDHLKKLDLSTNKNEVQILKNLDNGHFIEPLEFRRRS